MRSASWSRSGCGTAMTEHESTHARRGQFADQGLERHRSAALPGHLGEALRPSVQPDGQPVARDPEARRQALRILGHREQGQDDAGGTGGESQLDLLRAIHAPGQLQRRRHGPGDGLHGRGVHGSTGRRAVEVDQVDGRRPELHEVTSDALGSVGRRAGAGRRAGPEDEPRASGLEVDAGDDLHAARAEPQRPGSGRGSAGPGPSPASNRRWKLTGRLPA